VTQARAEAALGATPPAVLVLTGVVCVQVGAGLAARLFSQVSPAAVTGLRLWAAALLLAVLGARGLRREVTGLVRRRAWADAAVVVAFGLTLAVMNYCIYQAFARIPLGVAVTVEFLGPLAVAVAATRRALDLAWVALAAAGVALLSQAGGPAPGAAAHPVLSHGTGAPALAGPTVGGLDLAGLLFALAAAASWAIYILLSAATGRRFPGSSGLTVAMIVAALAVTPTGLLAGGRSLLRPGVLATGAAIGLLSSIIPYSLELETLRRVPPKVFGIWMSLEPAIAALVGLVMLSQSLSLLEWAAIGCVTVASAGAALSAR
jgi:inner membrane transporter RhtA